MPGSLISAVIIEPPHPRPGESVLVDVQLTASNGPSPRRVTIGGVPGARRYLQFGSPGQRRIVVRATDGVTEETEYPIIDVVQTPVTIRSTASSRPLVAKMRARQLQANPYEVQFSIGAPQPPTPPASTDIHSVSTGNGSVGHAGPAAMGISALTAATAHLTERPGALKPVRPTAVVGPQVVAPGSNLLKEVDAALGKIRNAIPTQYEWDFGDGTTAVTDTAQARHDFYPAIGPTEEFHSFDVSCHIVPDDVTVVRTLTVMSAYAISRQMGVIVPHTTGEQMATWQFGQFRSQFTLYNVEPTALTLDHMAMVELSDDPDAPGPFPTFRAMQTPITVPARSTSAIFVNVPIGPEISSGASGFSVIYSGHVGNLPVRLSRTFEVPASERFRKVHVQETQPPEEHQSTWPWDRVQSKLEELVNVRAFGQDIVRDHVSIDAASGTIAVTFGAIEQRVSAGRYGRVSTEVQRAIDAPVAAMSAGREAQATVARQMAPGTSLSQLPGDVQRLGPGVLRGTGAALRDLNTEPIESGPVAEGEVCDPSNLTAAQLAQAQVTNLVCQTSGEIIDVVIPGRFINARKGDVILSPGGTGLIASLLRSLDPPQWYSHSGMMTSNYTEITHSTASEERLRDHTAGIDGSEGFDPPALKYMWPGAVTQLVEDAIYGEPFPDPDVPEKTYQISSFSPHSIGVTHNEDFVIVPPIVVKPDPMLETSEIRARLHAVADQVRAIGGRPDITSGAHYRLYAYTDPTIGETSVAPPEAGWAAGTVPTVCSSMIWRAVHQASEHMETDTGDVMPSDLEPQDVASGAFVRPGVPDGLYTYTAAERRAAADTMFEKIHHEILEMEWGWLEPFTDAADDVANQLLNAFASDVADGKDSDAWKQTTDADAVSPDNLRWWDGPTQSGLYGFAEPLQYVEPRTEPYAVCRWKTVPPPQPGVVTSGTLQGVVSTPQGGLVGGAFVEVYTGKSDFADEHGQFAIEDVPFGSYMLRASRLIEGVLYSTQVPVNLQTETYAVNLVVQPPADRYRLAQVYYDFYGRDDEIWPWSDEVHNPGPEYVELELGPDRPSNTYTVTYYWGGEMRAEYTFTLRLLVNNSIDVEVHCKLYEGTTESTDDLDGEGGIDFQVAPGLTGTGTLVVHNQQEDVTDDRGELVVTVKNARNSG